MFNGRFSIAVGYLRDTKDVQLNLTGFGKKTTFSFLMSYILADELFSLVVSLQLREIT